MRSRAFPWWGERRVPGLPVRIEDGLVLCDGKRSRAFPWWGERVTPGSTKWAREEALEKLEDNRRRAAERVKVSIYDNAVMISIRTSDAEALFDAVGRGWIEDEVVKAELLFREKRRQQAEAHLTIIDWRAFVGPF